MFNKLKSYITIASLIIALISGAYGIYKDIKSDRLARENANLKDELTVKTTEVITYTNKLGQLVTKTIEYEKSLSDLKNSNDSIEQELYKTLKASSIKDKQIKSMSRIIATGNNSGVYSSIDTVPIIKVDTMYLGTIKKYNDDFINITCTEDSISYNTNLELDIFTAYRLVPRRIQPFKWLNKKWVLNKTIDKNTVEVTTNIPNSKVLLRSIKIK